jgi:predicted esterase
MKRILSLSTCVSLLLLITAIAAKGEWRRDLKELIDSDSPSEQNRLLQKVLEVSPDWEDVVSVIQGIDFPRCDGGIFQLRTVSCIDDVKRPWVIFVPPQYDPTRSTPLMIVLHGGVSRTEIIEDPEEYARDHFLTPLAEMEGWLLVFPFGQEKATWWDEVGMTNIRTILRTAKREFNVDDDRVWMGGFSDGASAAFLHAMLDPCDYAAFIALNGHMGVGSLDGDLPTYAPNMSNTPVYAVTTDMDELYPTRAMRGTLDMAVDAGGDVFYRIHRGTHEFSYGEDELPLIGRFLKRHPRDPFPVRIIWETADRRFGTCRWLSLDEITTGDAASWHGDHNAILVDERIVIGFIIDNSFEGKGVRVDRVMEEGSLAGTIGLQSGDVIVRCNDVTISSIDDLDRFKAGVKRGDDAEITVLRNEETHILSGAFPEPLTHFVFKRTHPSALARARFCGNRIDVEPSRVGAFRILVHPDMVRIDENVVVRVNGEVKFDETPRVDLEYLIGNFLKNRDRKLLYTSAIDIIP